MGSSVLGSAGGFAWTHAGWPGVTGFCLVVGGAALAIGLRLRAVPPLRVEPVAAPRMPVP
jgi:YNFM family putative membrane transporter